MRARSFIPLLLILLPPVFFWRETLGWITLGDQDAVFWFFPAYKFFSEQILSGALPLWTPYLYSGTPLFAQWQAGMLDPINLIYLFGATSRTLTLSLEMSFAISLISAYFYAQILGFDRRAGVVTAVIYSLSGFAVGRTLYPGYLHIIALVPLVLYFIEKIYRDGRWRDVILGSLIVAWQIFAAHPQPLIYSSLLAAAYALFRFPISNLRSSLRFLFRFGSMFIAGAGLAAVQLVPAFEIAKESVRREWPYELFTLHSLHPASLATTLFPFFHGSGRTIYQMPYWGVYWHHNEAQIYLGLIALALAIGAALAGAAERNRLAIFWSGAAAAGAILSLGKYTGPLSRALYHFPLLSHFRSPNRHWMVVTLAVAVLAGYAIDKLLKGESQLLGRRVKLVAIILTLLTTSAGAFFLLRKDAAQSLIRSLPDLGGLPENFLQAGGAEFYIPVISALLACLLLLIFLHSNRRRVWYWPLFGFLLIDYHLYAVFAPINNPFQLETLVGKAMPPLIAEKQSEKNPIRYHVMLNPITGEFNPFWYYGHEMATGYDPMLNSRYKTFSGMDEAGRTYLSSILEARDRTLDLLNVRYVLIPPIYFTDDGAANDSPIELKNDARAVYSGKDANGSSLTIVSALTNSVAIPDGREIAEIEIRCGSASAWKSTLLAGRDTSEWAYDRADVKRAIRHSRAPISESAPGDAAASFQAHSYQARFTLPDEVIKCAAEKSVQLSAKVQGETSLSIKRVIFDDASSGKSVALARRGNAALNDRTRWSELAARSPAKPYREFRVFENNNALPRAWIVNRARIAYEGDQLKLIRGELAAGGDAVFDPRATALVDHETAARIDSSLINRTTTPAPGSVNILKRSSEGLTLEANAQAPSILVLSEVYQSGLKATVDGTPAEIFRVDYNLCGVALSPGNKKIEVRYAPQSIKVGAWVSALTLLGLCILYLVATWRFRRARPI